MEVVKSDEEDVRRANLIDDIVHNMVEAEFQSGVAGEIEKFVCEEGMEEAVRMVELRKAVNWTSTTSTTSTSTTRTTTTISTTPNTTIGTGTEAAAAMTSNLTCEWQGQNYQQNI